MCGNGKIYVTLSLPRPSERSLLQREAFIKLTVGYAMLTPFSRRSRVLSTNVYGQFRVYAMLTKNLLHSCVTV